MTVTSGRKCSALLKKQDPLGCLAKMLLESSAWNSTLCYLTWQPSATPAKRVLFQLAAWTPRTAGTGSGLWRTPDASVISGGAANAQDRKKQNHAIGLHDQVNTPSMWPTPRSNKVHPEITEKNRDKLANRNKSNLEEAVAGETTQSGSLNPAFVEFLMNYPKDWTKV
jgi:hypothetical protein